MLYGLSNLTYYIVYYGIGYRKKVVRQNLERSFPNLSNDALKKIEKDFYRHLFDILLEGVKGFSLSQKELVRRHQLITPDLLKGIIDRGQSVLLVGGHYANWEWAGMVASKQSQTDVVILYSPIKNPYIDNFIKKSRSLYNTYFWASHLAPRAFRKYKNDPLTFVLIADQSPSNPKRAHWMPFLNQDTPVLRGPASYAVQYDMPLLFIDFQRVKRGYYTMEISVLADNPKAYSPEELTTLYMRKLEQIIQERPEQWLWSHRRWKHRRTKEASPQ